MRNGAYIATADILDQLRVNFRLFNDLLQERVYKIVELCILESTLETLCQWCTDGEGDNYIIGILGSAVDMGISMR